MAGEMKDYLNATTADYTTTQLSISPQRVLEEKPIFNQVIHEAIDGTIEVVEFDSNIYFDVILEWENLTESEAQTIFDFFMDSSKANKYQNTFEWVHPTDATTEEVTFQGEAVTFQGETVYWQPDIVYIARFIEDVTKRIKSRNINGIARLKLRIEGYKNG